jgi:hypothetical protein
MFGCAEKPSRGIISSRTSNISNISRDGIIYNNSSFGTLRYNTNIFKQLRAACTEGFELLLEDNKVEVALGAIHSNPSHYWQVHGIAACSAGVHGGLSVAASHFSNRLPNRNGNLLAAINSPANYLTMKKKNRSIKTTH